jgi:hypothetical protein
MRRRGVAPGGGQNTGQGVSVGQSVSQSSG